MWFKKKNWIWWQQHISKFRQILAHHCVVYGGEYCPILVCCWIVFILLMPHMFLLGKSSTLQATSAMKPWGSLALFCWNMQGFLWKKKTSSEWDMLFYNLYILSQKCRLSMSCCFSLLASCRHFLFKLKAETCHRLWQQLNRYETVCVAHWAHVQFASKCLMGCWSYVSSLYWACVTVYVCGSVGFLPLFFMEQQSD